ncbi:Serine protease 46 [Apodemus speciosus]|uniref:Serine protease 46 n=1 Tax=Apodemus speciosus TaxID=105296 RepID=A0ABQ0F648_APOSI
MATSLRGLVAGPGSLSRWILTCFAALLLQPPRPNLGYNENHIEPVCGTPWWPDSLEESHHWPWEVSLQIENEHVCGGALISRSWVVSAAHCIQSNKEYSVMLGSSTLHPNGSSWALKIPVGDIIMHPKYWGRNFVRSDVALLCLETPVVFNKYVQPICLPEQDFSLKVGTKCWVTGWGHVKPHPSGVPQQSLPGEETPEPRPCLPRGVLCPPALQRKTLGSEMPRSKVTLTPELWEAEVFIIDNKNCDSILHKKTFYPRGIPLIRKNMICTTNYGEDLCYGDPGGPLACEVDGRWILAGIFSWEKACAKVPNLSVYTRITKYTVWIKQQGPWFWSCGQTNISCKVVDGKVVEVGKWPWQVSILFLGMYVCSGSLIHHHWVLTAAHCLQRSKNPANYTVKVGVQTLPDNSSSELLVNSIVIHENFINHMSHDIAILKLKYPVTWSPLIQPICLPAINFKPSIGTMCWVIGWGLEKAKGTPKTPYSVQGLAVRIVNNEICNHRYQFLLLKNQKKFIGNDMLCTSSEWGLDTCQDTSGSSLVCQMNKTWVQMGVVSWNFGCGRRQFPSVYTSTSHFTQWIKRQIGDLKFASMAVPSFLSPFILTGYILLVSLGSLWLL